MVQLRAYNDDMKLEEQVCSLELAMRLKELGVKQESLLWWRETTVSGEAYISHWEGPKTSLHYSAFTVAELGTLLPVDLQYDLASNLPTRTTSGGWRVDLDDEGMLYAGSSEADARAKMLVYLLEHQPIDRVRRCESRFSRRFDD